MHELALDALREGHPTLHGAESSARLARAICLLCTIFGATREPMRTQFRSHRSPVAGLLWSVSGQATTLTVYILGQASPCLFVLC